MFVSTASFRTPKALIKSAIVYKLGYQPSNTLRYARILKPKLHRNKLENLS